MKPYGLASKISIGKCGCCAVGRSDDYGLYPWRAKSVRNATKKKYRHRARQANAKLVEAALSNTEQGVYEQCTV